MTQKGVCKVRAFDVSGGSGNIGPAGAPVRIHGWSVYDGTEAFLGTVRGGSAVASGAQTNAGATGTVVLNPQCANTSSQTIWLGDDGIWFEWGAYFHVESGGHQVGSIFYS
jgi:hypothetical protein